MLAHLTTRIRAQRAAAGEETDVHGEGEGEPVGVVLGDDCVVQ